MDHNKKSVKIRPSSSRLSKIYGNW